VRAILTTLLADRRVSDETIEAFENLARRPGTEISPHGDRLSPNLAHYMLKPLRDGFLRSLETLPAPTQETVLLEGAARCRELRGAPPPALSVADRRRASFENLVDEAVRQNPDPDSGDEESAGDRRWYVQALQRLRELSRQGAFEGPLREIRARYASRVRRIAMDGLRSTLEEARASGREVMVS
jgi:hypothetical protein